MPSLRKGCTSIAVLSPMIQAGHLAALGVMLIAVLGLVTALSRWMVVRMTPQE